MHTPQMIATTAPTLVAISRCFIAAWIMLLADQLLRIAFRMIPEGHPAKVFAKTAHPDCSRQRRCVANALRVR